MSRRAERCWPACHGKLQHEADRSHTNTQDRASQPDQTLPFGGWSIHHLHEPKVQQFALCEAMANPFPISVVTPIMTLRSIRCRIKPFTNGLRIDIIPRATERLIHLFAPKATRRNRMRIQTSLTNLAPTTRTHTVSTCS